MGNEGISVADALALRNSNSGNAWGGDGSWWIILLILLFAGYGNGFGGNGAYNACCTPATAQGISDAFNFNQVDNDIRGVQSSISDSLFATTNAINALGSNFQNCCCQNQLTSERGFNSVNQGICDLGYKVQSGFNGIDRSIMEDTFNSQAGFNALSNLVASNACDIERGQENIKTALTAATNEILIASDKNTDRIINYLTQSEMNSLRNELQSTKFQLSQLAQTDSIIDRLMPTAKPAYLTCSPYVSSLGYGSTGCGCA